MIIESRFRPAWWLANAHAQTIYPTLARRLKPPVDVVKRFELPDGDFIDTAWSINGLSNDTPLVIILHGLGGSIDSNYVGGLMHAFHQQGWRSVLMHFRGASQEPNRLSRAYHSGDTEDLNTILKAIVEVEPKTSKAVVGVSLGGNVLLKWLGEQGKQSTIKAAVAVSVPFQLGCVADRINRGFSRLYQRYLLKKMKIMFLRKQDLTADSLIDIKTLKSIKCFWTFDNLITAPLHGFRDVHEYYRCASSKAYMANIATPTLVIHALDDPFMTPEILPRAEDLSADVTLEVSLKGGHVGFIEGSIPGQANYWLDQRIPQYLQPFLKSD